MSRFILDNTVVSALLRPAKRDARDDHRRDQMLRLFEISDALFLVPAVALAETLCGLDPAVSAAVVDKLAQFENLEVVPFDGKAAREFGRIFKLDDVPEGKPKAKFDLMIIATAVRYKAGMVTFDTKQRDRASALSLDVGEPSRWIPGANQGRLFEP